MMGLLDKRVTVKRIDKMANGRGGWITQEVDLGLRWAAILPITAREIAQYQALEREADTRIVMRRDPEITTDCVIYDGEYKYKIDDITDRLRFSGYIEMITRGEKI